MKPASVAMAGGQPLDSRIADEAADWLTQVMSEDATEETWVRLRAWRDADPDHERAWRHIEAVIGRLRGNAGSVSYKVLSPYANLGGLERRRLLGLFFYAGAFGLAVTLGSRTQSWQRVVADYRTATGEQRQVTLHDGTRILLNTASAIDVQFDARLRRVRLLAGEIRVVTGHAGERLAPFVVDTQEGRIKALGTRFTVSQEDGTTRVAVEEHAVEISPVDLPDLRQPLRQGQRTSFSRSQVGAALALTDAELAWTHGQLIADEQRLVDFLDDLNRYRPGVVRCDPAVASLRLSGVFPLNDTDAIFRTLPSVLPVSVRMRTRYWVVVEAAS
ncbi:FecR domain-containing protein [Pseudomonas sp. 148P]|uniref:FecR domain-containing protein n=1 Tax=Pseudomonas ulcerans TaxID=3115852 RepID=A0ABU7HNR5_9PSED|nr:MULTISPECIES: FecR domain-containing protein [unclassified Pseudomonas]MEE1923677.1 FecR domain-containing protein [Pseudomonas sp. 147P]MEE1933175.1 FecR domain-containing protein [Pseudomonas sp. 148P]